MSTLSKWVWDKNAGADTALQYVNRGFAIERFGEIMSGSNHKCKCLKVIFVWAEYYFLIPFLRLVDVRNKSRLDPSDLRLSIPRTKFKEFCTALISLIVFRESSLEIK